MQVLDIQQYACGLHIGLALISNKILILRWLHVTMQIRRAPVKGIGHCRLLCGGGKALQRPGPIKSSGTLILCLRVLETLPNRMSPIKEWPWVAIATRS